MTVPTAPAAPSGAPPADPVAVALREWDRAAWCAAALALAARPGCDPALAGHARAVLAAAGVPAGPDGAAPLISGSAPEQTAAQAAAGLLNAATVAAGRSSSWADSSDEALLTQGRASAQFAAALQRFVLPLLGDLGDRLARPGARMLDVGTGVAALATAVAEAFPHLRVVGLDVLERPLALARRTVAASPAGDRVELRLQDVGDLADDEGFDLVWLPAPFLPPAALERGLDRLATAVRPGGWVLLPHDRAGEDAVQDAVNRLKVAAYGGSPVDTPTAHRLLGEHGFTDLTTLPTPPGAPAVVAGRRP
jgi:predicted RNA methylase